MPSPPEPTIPILGAPFPVAVLDRDTRVRWANDAWRAVAPTDGSATDALQLYAEDRHPFAATVERVFDDRRPAWVDVDVPVLAEKRWVRCHVWPHGTEHVAAAVVPLREARASDLPRVDVDHIERILEHTADAITIVDEHMTFRFASGIATRWLGMSGANYEGHPALSFVYPEDHQLLVDAFAHCIEAPRRSIKARFRVVHEHGHVIWVEGIGTNMFDDPAIEGILVTLNDITELVEARAEAEANETALDAEKQRYEMLAQLIPTGVFELDATDRLTFRNERFTELTGLDEGDDLLAGLVDESGRADLRAALERTRAGEATVATVRLAGARSSDPRWLTIRTVGQESGRILASIEDATLEITTQAELTHRVDHDALTGLPNRERMLVQLRNLLDAREPIAVLFLDLDNFKDINDGLGHQAGDQVLVEIADRIEAAIRPTDIVGRLHGDEFLIVCRQTSELQTAREIATRVVGAVSEPLSTTSQGLLVSGSVGIALSSETDAFGSPEQLIVAADVAMYEAKRRGGARSVPFNRELGRRAADRLRLHGEVQRAGELDELELHYQPIVELSSGAVVRTEALVRWHHPTQGFILPDRFIPDIEKSELIGELGRWVLARVVDDLAAAGPDALPVNVNMSPHQLLDDAFAESTLATLEQRGVDASLLTVEITELVMMADFAPVERQLELLQRAGVGIAVDDFGTGYSALAYLQRFPFDQIKIDGVFIDSIDASPKDLAIVRSIIDLVEALDAVPIAEKVERQVQADLLTELGCPLAQGFLLGRPQPALR